jgi:uncharacterized protein YndB with AHSA1/START domain
MTERNPAAAGPTTGDELFIERVFDAPREMVYRAWTERDQFVQWWGPDGFTTPHCTIDLRVGGRFHLCMRSAEYGDIWCGGVFHEIDPPSRLVYGDYFTDEQGNRVPATHYGMSADFPEETLTTITFEDIGGGRTRMTLRQAIPSALAEREGAFVGWNQSFDRLAAYLATGSGG